MINQNVNIASSSFKAQRHALTRLPAMRIYTYELMQI